MDTVIVFLQAGLAIVLAVAGVAKLRDLPGSRQAVRDFGVPDRWSVLLGTALPIGEVILAAFLLFEAPARWAAIGASILFLIFIVAIGYNLAQGKQPDCHCFGQLHSEPAGWPTLARNVLLAAGAILVAGQGGRSIGNWYSDLTLEGQAGILLGLPVVAGVLAVARSVRIMEGQQRDLVSRFETLAISIANVRSTPELPTSPSDDVRLATPFDLPDLSGGRLTLSRLLSLGKPALLLFTDPRCGPCTRLVPEMVEWNRRFGNEITVAMIGNGTIEENRAKFADHALPFVGLQKWPDVSEPYGVRATPAAVLVDTDGFIRAPNANGQNQIRELIARTIDEYRAAEPVEHQGSIQYNPDGSIAQDILTNPAGAIPVGQSAPRLPLPVLDGGFQSLGDFQGQRLLVVFWSTTCWFCNKMLPDIREWEDEVAASSPVRLVFAAAGTPADLRAQGLRSTVLLDEDLASLCKAFGAPGTPSAVVIDENGRVASEVMNGTDAILDYLDEQVAVPAQAS